LHSRKAFPQAKHNEKHFSKTKKDVFLKILSESHKIHSKNPFGLNILI